MKILHVVSALDHSGVDGFLYNYYSRMDREKISFDFAVYNQPEEDKVKRFTDLGCKYFVLPKKKDGIFKSIRALKKVVKENHYDAVHIHQEMNSVVPLLATKKIKRRLTHMHTTYTAMPLKQKLKYAFFRPVLKMLSTDYVACGIMAGQTLWGDRAVKKGKVKIIHNAVDLDRFLFNKNAREEIRREYGVLDNELLLGLVGRLAPEKNHKFIIDVLEEVVKANDKVKLAIIGGGELKEEITEYVSKKGLNNNVIFTGAVKDVNRYYSALDIMVMPSLREGLSVAMVEAQTSGLKVFSSDVVPKESAITDVEFFPFDVKVWKDKILGFTIRENRVLTEEEKSVIINAGFDISVETAKIEEYYLSKKV